MIILLTTLDISKYASNKNNLDMHLNQVFVSFSDGLVHELKVQTDLDYITYRNQTLNKLDLSCSALTCFLAVIDSHFEEEFLGWNKYRPSNFFKTNML
jgi:hypothetical protein